MLRNRPRSGPLAEAQAAVERERVETEEAVEQEVDSVIRGLTRPPAKPFAYSHRVVSLDAAERGAAQKGLEGDDP
jgi:hypothetical protein